MLFLLLCRNLACFLKNCNCVVFLMRVLVMISEFKQHVMCWVFHFSSKTFLILIYFRSHLVLNPSELLPYFMSFKPIQKHIHYFHQKLHHDIVLIEILELLVRSFHWKTHPIVNFRILRHGTGRFLENSSKTKHVKGK